MSKLTDIKFILDSEGDNHPLPDKYMSAIIEGVDFKISRINENMNKEKFEDFVIYMLKISHYTIAEELLNKFVDMMEDKQYVSDLLSHWRKNTSSYLEELKLNKKCKGLRYVLENVKMMVGPKPATMWSIETGNLTKKPVMYTEHVNHDVSCRVESFDGVVRIHLDVIKNGASNLIFHYEYKDKSYAEISEEIRSLFAKDWLTKTLINLRITSNLGDIPRVNALIDTFSEDKLVRNNQVEILSHTILLTLINILEYEMNSTIEYIEISNSVLQKFHKWGLQYI